MSSHPNEQEAPGNSHETRLLQLFQQRIPEARKGATAIPILPFGQWARQAWPVKAPANIAYFTGCHERTAKSWLAGESTPSYHSVVTLLHCDKGESFLHHIIGDARPRWWIDLHRGGAIRPAISCPQEAAE